MPQKIRNSLPYNLNTLESASREALGSWFLAVFGQTPGPRASLTFLRQNLAWAAQARVSGLDPRQRRERLLRQLSRVAEGYGRGNSAYRPGTRLVREWQGTVYEITVLEDGYAWEGRTYRSLTRIATEITGTKWSGPRFFGLKGEKDGAN